MLASNDYTLGIHLFVSRLSCQVDQLLQVLDLPIVADIVDAVKDGGRVQIFPVGYWLLRLKIRINADQVQI